jgi:hypothetical protein
LTAGAAAATLAISSIKAAKINTMRLLFIGTSFEILGKFSLLSYHILPGNDMSMPVAREAWLFMVYKVTEKVFHMAGDLL